MFANGVIFGIDPLVSQGHGAGDGRRVALALQRGTVLAALLSLPVIGAWLFTEDILRLMGQEPALAAAAQRYVLVQIPSVPFFLGFSALRQYLQGREMVRPALWVVLAANVLNALFNWVLIFGKLGFPALGLVGSGIATALTRAFMGLALLYLVRVFSLQRGAWIPWSREAFDPQGLGAVLAIGLPVALQVSLEMWAFGGSTLIAGKLGATALAAHTVAMNLASITFMVPLGIAQGAGVRVGNLLGAGHPLQAQRTAFVAMVLGAGVMSLSACTFVTFRHGLPHIYTPDPGVTALAARILPIAAAFQIFDGTQAVASGILRGMGRTRPAAVFNFVGYWILALPLGAGLALRTPAGLAGLWWGLCLGLAVVASCLFVWVWRRGPASWHPVASP